MALTVPVAEIVESSKNPLLGKHESWGRVLLGDIATIQNGFPFKSSQFTRDEGMPLIRIRDVGADSSETFYVGDYDPAYVVEAGDLLIGMDGDFNCARWRGPKGLLNQRVCRVILKSDIYHPKLLDHALPGYLKAINDMTSSVTVKHLSSKSIAEIPLPLPPMDQQKRIVAEIEKQFSRLDEAVANLKRVKANLKRYKAAVLKAAVEGRLVETEAELARRAAQGSANVAGGRTPGATEGRSYETGAQLLQHILETRRSQWKGKGKYKEPAAPDTTDLLELPEGWVWATVEQLTWLLTSGSRGWGEFYSETGVLFIRAQDIKTDELKLASVARVNVPSDAEGTRSSVNANDILITITGANVTKSALVPSLSEQAFVSQHVALLKLNMPEMAYFVFSWIVSPVNGRKTLEALAYGAGKPGLSLEQLRALRVPIPPLVEQNRIVAEVDRRLSLVREVETQVDANLMRAERLRQSVLAMSFNGRLVDVSGTRRSSMRACVAE